MTFQNIKSWTGLKCKEDGGVCRVRRAWVTPRQWGDGGRRGCSMRSKPSRPKYLTKIYPKIYPSDKAAQNIRVSDPNKPNNTKNKLASLEATLVRNFAHWLTDSLTEVKCRATSVAKKLLSHCPAQTILAAMKQHWSKKNSIWEQINSIRVWFG